MRSFYGVDRIDNAYFISENFSESLIERDYLFSTASFGTSVEDTILAKPTNKAIKALSEPNILGMS